MLFYTDKAASVFFPQVNKITQVYFTFPRLLPCCKTKTKGIQEQIKYENAAISTPAVEVSSVYTEPLESDATAINSSVSEVLWKSIDNVTDHMTRRPENWDSVVKFYGNNDTTEIWDPTSRSPRINNRKIENKRGQKRNYKDIDITESNICECIKKDRRHKSKNQTDEIGLPEQNTEVASPKYGKRKQKSYYTDTKSDKDGKIKKTEKYDTNRDYEPNNPEAYYETIAKQKIKPSKRKKERNKRKHEIINNEMIIEPYDDYNAKDNKGRKKNVDVISENVKHTKRSKNRKQQNHDKPAEGNDFASKIAEKISPNRTEDYQNEKYLGREFDIPVTTKLTLDGKCLEGICADAAKTDNKSYLCKCKKRRFLPTECTNDICELPEQYSDTVLKKMKCLCRRYSRMLRIKRGKYTICERGICDEASRIDKDNFRCKCVKIEKKPIVCTDVTCANETSKGKESKKLHKLIKKKRNLTVIKKYKQKNNCKCIQNSVCQTGEPAFELKVNSSNMCVLNSRDIQKKVKTLGTKRIPDCICPSRMRKLEFRPRKICLTGVCQNASEDKMTYVNCKCPTKERQCTDTTCDGPIQCLDHNELKPLFDVNLDSNLMCIINSDEVQNNVKNFKNQHCKNAICQRQKDWDCKCINKKPRPQLVECFDDETCNNCRCRRKRVAFDTKSIKNLPSLIYFVCSRVFHKKDIGNEKESNCICCSCPSAGGVDPCICKADNTKEFKKNTPIINRNAKRQSIDIKEPLTSSQGNRSPGRTRIISPAKRQITSPVKSQVVSPTKTHRTLEEMPNKETGNAKDNEVICTCHHDCECDEEMLKRKAKTSRDSNQAKGRLAEINSKLFLKRMNKDEKLRRKRAKQEHKWKRKEIRKLQKEMGTKETNFFVDFIMGILRMVGSILKTMFIVFYKLIKDPKGSYWYVKKRVSNTEETFYKVKRWFEEWWELRKLKVQNTIAGSETLSVLSDTIQETPVFRAIASKGKTKADERRIDMEKRDRQRRITKRRNQALYGCRHALLTTLRQHPCLWFYHILPTLYPQCLSCVACTKNFMNLIILCLAFMFWTPCIVSAELCRALCCCIFCTQ